MIVKLHVLNLVTKVSNVVYHVQVYSTELSALPRIYEGY